MIFIYFNGSIKNIFIIGCEHTLSEPESLLNLIKMSHSAITNKIQQEFEVKFLGIDVKSIREKLFNIGASRVHGPEKYVRAVYHMAKPNIKGYCRVRREINKVYITAKIYITGSNFPQEIELQLQDNEISNAYDQAQCFLDAIGLEKKSDQQSLREKFTHPYVHEITIDTLPGLPPFMEIDCTSIENLNLMIKLLNLPPEMMRYGAYDKTYNEYYGIELETINNKTPYLTFANILNEIEPIRNQQLLEEIAAQQKIL